MFDKHMFITTDAATNARFLCEQVYLCSPDVIIEEHNGEINIKWGTFSIKFVQTT